jgi:hypothetical protein
MLQVIQASGGQVTAADFRNAIQYGRLGAQGWDKEFISGPLARMIQEYKSGGGSAAGGGPGNALMSLFAANIQGKTKKDASEEFENLGLGPMKDVGLTDNNGRRLFLKNPYEWLQQVLVPAMAAKGITSKEDIIAELGLLYGNRTAAAIAGNMYLGGRAHLPGFNEHGDPNSTFEKDMVLNKMAAGEPAFDSLIKQDYPMLMQAFSEQFHNLLEVLGSGMMAPDGPVIRAMSGLVEGMASMNKFFADNPMVVNVMMTALASLAAALAAFATGALLTVMSMLMPGGLIVVAIAGLVGALGTMAALNWESIKSVANSIGDFFAMLHRIGKYKVFELPDWMKWGDKPTLQKQSFEGNGPGAPRLQPASFNPNNQKQVLQPIQMELKIDGRTLASAVSEALQDLYNHPTGAASPNGWDNFTSADSNYTST